MVFKHSKVRSRKHVFSCKKLNDFFTYIFPVLKQPITIKLAYQTFTNLLKFIF